MRLKTVLPAAGLIIFAAWSASAQSVEPGGSGLKLALASVLHKLLNWAVASAWVNRPPSNLQLAQGYAELALIAVAASLAAALAIFSLEHVRAAVARAKG